MTSGTIASLKELRDTYRAGLEALAKEIVLLKKENRKLRAELRGLRAQEEYVTCRLARELNRNIGEAAQ